MNSTFTLPLWFHIAVPIATLLIGYILGYVGISSAVTSIKTDITDIKNLLHVSTPTPTAVTVVTPAHA